MERFHRIVGSSVEVVDRLSGACLAVIVAMNLAAVFMRYVMLDSISWSEEGIRYVAVWMTFFGAAAASWFDEHMDMNMLAEFGGAAFQSWHRGLLHALTAVFAGFVLWQGVIYCKLNGMQTAPTTGLRMIFVYGALALGGLLLLIVSLAKIYEVFAKPRRPESDHKAVL